MGYKWTAAFAVVLVGLVGVACAPKSTTRKACNTDSDCSQHQICDDGICIIPVVAADAAFDGAGHDVVGWDQTVQDVGSFDLVSDDRTAAADAGLDSGDICAPLTTCDDGCVDLETNMQNCGSCDSNCATIYGTRVNACINSLCVCTTHGNQPCPLGENCNATGCEIDCPAAQTCGTNCCTATDDCISFQCCPEARACSGTCCAANEACVGGACCNSGKVCQQSCCAGDQTCVDNACCNNAQVCGTQCCRAAESCLNDSCCAVAKVCGSNCCSGSESCLDDTCCATDRICGSNCCASNQTCIGGACCPQTQACADTCCTAGDSCIADACCPQAQACGSQCCGGNQSCLHDQCCPTAQVCGSTCCAATDSCIGGSCCAIPHACGDTCCSPSEWCHAGTECRNRESGVTLVYVTDNTYDGNLGGRVGADGICASEKPEVLNCSSLHALLSVNASDEIQDLPANYGFQSTQPLYFFCRERGWLTQFAESWADALDGSILVRPSTAMQGFYDQYWTGSNNLGALEPGSGSWDYLCVNWTATNANYSLGGEGNRSSTTSWLYASGKPQCTADLHLLCACRLQ